MISNVNVPSGGNLNIQADLAYIRRENDDRKICEGMISTDVGCYVCAIN